VTTISIFDEAGGFAENKDVARRIRESLIRPEITKGIEVTLDFDQVELATQSFVHALISDLIRTPSLDALEKLVFTNCDDDVRTIIDIVVDYSQDDVAANGT
jgi:STAS-like domain of unknown function (DUF4325)